jgi:hypothetical protein
LNERSSTPAELGNTARSSRLVERLDLGCISTWIVAMIQAISQCPPTSGAWASALNGPIDTAIAGVLYTARSARLPGRAAY